MYLGLETWEIHVDKVNSTIVEGEWVGANECILFCFFDFWPTEFSFLDFKHLLRLKYSNRRAGPFGIAVGV